MIITATQASPERIRADQERRRSSAASRHVDKARAAKRPGHGNRHHWKREDQ
jgi:hypothetical protein